MVYYHILTSLKLTICATTMISVMDHRHQGHGSRASHRSDARGAHLSFDQRTHRGGRRRDGCPGGHRWGRLGPGDVGDVGDVDMNFDESRDSDFYSSSDFDDLW